MNISTTVKPFGITPFKTTLVCTSSAPTLNFAEEETIPLPRSGHRMVCVDQKLYIFGGYNPNIEAHCDPYWQLTKPLFAELWHFNTTTGTWGRMYQCHMRQSDGLVSFSCALWHFNTTTGTWGRMYQCHMRQSDGLVSFSCAVSGVSMFHLGGTGVPFGESSSNCLQVCDLLTGEWERLETGGTKPLPSYGQAMVLDEDELYVVGGTTGYEYSMDVHKISVVDRVWHELYKTRMDQIEPMTRYRHEMIRHGDDLLIFGGGQKDDTAPLHRLPAFSLKDLAWHFVGTEPDRILNKYPSPRKCHVMVQHDHYVYIHGGCNENISFGDMWRLDLRTLRWQELRYGATSPRHFHAAAITKEGCLYMHGGVLADPAPRSQRTGDLLKCWLTVPSLHRMCWEALLHFHPRLLQLSPLQLYHLGIPTLDIRECELIPSPRSTAPAMRPVSPPPSPPPPPVLPLL
ncbi:Galactose oxidase/kelch beta-propeller [Trinorchestia longiramus]|nr:Galactose oxidase/kelch beta-propeller [Trinorchestia longiramus]